MDTITFEHQGQTFEVPVVFAFGPDGQPADLVGDVEPEHCNHAGATWSSNRDMRCPRCGSRLFLPGRLLAYLPEATIERMNAAWEAAGWPEFRGGSTPGWSIIPDRWTVVDVLPDFAHVGGLPVRCDRAETFWEAIR
jgi:DNA-directed RNA polymerase subunit RPC12/RpoP